MEDVDAGVTEYAVLVFTGFLEKMAATAALAPVLPELASSTPASALRRSKRLQVPQAGGSRFSSPDTLAAVYTPSSPKV